MRTRMLDSTTELAQVFRKWCLLAENIRVVTAWATTDCSICNCLSDARGKIATMVVGLDFYTTSPDFLRQFRSVIRIGDALNGGTFHPKLYVFQNGDRFCCVIGSSNFTSGGFGNNSELNVCIEGATSEPFFKQISAYIDEQEKNSEPLTKPEITDYRKQFEKLRTARTRLAKFHPTQAAKTKAKERIQRESAGEEPPEQLNKTWPEFVGLILAPKRRKRIDGGKGGEPDYLQTAERCQKLFAQHGTLAKMPASDRQFVGGTSHEGGWFGSMRGAGYFKQKLNQNPASLDAALDHIPRTGKISKAVYDRFADAYQWERAGVATASRLLAMKRPDLFICIDSKNRSSVAEAFGVSALSLQSFDGYWSLMQRIWHCPWWRAPRPQHALERRIWDARVALLDSVYYVENVT
ncbi:MAG TPA: phospholipase D-like domain-containing protein [Terriglobales bacterium]|nr:phospholipase D-like domain-containing protein [Terriglobales bacterium]